MNAIDKSITKAYQLRTESKAPLTPSAPKYSKKIDFIRDNALNLSRLSDDQLKDLKTLVRSWTHAHAKGAKPHHLTMEAVDYVASDISMGVRDLLPDSVAAQFAGVPTCLNLFMGAIAAERASRRLKKGIKTGDREGIFESVIDTIRGVAQSVAGAFYFGYRGTQIAAYLNQLDTSANATTALGQACYYLGTIGNGALAVLKAGFAVRSLFFLTKDIQWRKEVSGIEGNRALFKFFQKKVSSDPSVKLKKLSDKTKQFKEIRQEMREKGLHRVTKKFLKDNEDLSYAKARKGFEALFKALRKSGNEESSLKSIFQELGLEGERAERAHSRIKKMKWDTLALIGFQQSQKERTERKQARFSRVAGAPNVKLITDAAHRGLSERLRQKGAIREAAREELSSLKGRVLQGNTKNMLIQSAVLAISSTGLSLSIVSFLALFGAIAVTPGGAIALTVISILIALAMLALDGYELHGAWTSAGKPGIYDKEFAAGLGAFMLASFGGASALSILYKLNPSDLIVSGVICLIGFIAAMTSFLIATYKEDEWNRTHPSLKRFSKELRKENLEDEEVFKRFKQLSKADRKAIYNRSLKTAKKPQSSFTFTAQELNEEKGEPLLRAVKKTTRIFWKYAERTHSEEITKEALKLQQLLDLITEQEGEWEEEAVDKLNQRFRRLKNGEKTTFETLAKHMGYFEQICSDTTGRGFLRQQVKNELIQRKKRK